MDCNVKEDGICPSSSFCVEKIFGKSTNDLFYLIFLKNIYRMGLIFFGKEV